jgi:Tetratricopeptide repeat
LPANSRIEELTKRLEKEPGSRLFAQLAEELRKEGELGDAIRVCREGLARHPNYPSARMTLGRALLDTGDLAGARTEFDAVLKAAPDNILASRFLADCYQGLGELDQAEAQYRVTLLLAPGDKQMMTRLQAIEDARRSSMTTPVPALPAGLLPATAERSRPLGSPAPVSGAAPTIVRAAPPVVPLPAAAGDPPPIPLVAADEEFEIERPYEATAPAAFLRGPAEPRAPETAALEPEPEPIIRTAPMERPSVVEPPPPEAAPVEEVEPVTARFEPPVPELPPPFLAEETLPPVRHARSAPSPLSAPAPPPPAPPAHAAPPVATPPQVPAPTAAGFTELDDEITEAPPAPIEPPVRPVAIGDSSAHRRQAGLDTLFHFSALEEGTPASSSSPAVRPAPAAPPPPVPAPDPRPSAALVVAPMALANPSMSPVESGPAEIVSPTLAELYFSQGHIEKAAEVYRSLRRSGAESDRARLRLEELEEMLRLRLTPPAALAPPAEAGLSREERRTATLQKIERLEQLLSVIQKR